MPFLISLALAGTVGLMPFKQAGLNQCLDRWEQKIKGLPLRGDWRKVGPSIDGDLFRSQSTQFGRSFEFLVKSDGTGDLYVISNAAVEVTRFSKGCAETPVLRRPGLDFSVKFPDEQAQFIDDQKLEKIIGEKKRGIFYVWSPAMVYSNDFRTVFKATAQKLGLSYIELVDPTFVRGSFNKNDRFDRMNSVELQSRGVLNHFPTALIFENGKILDLPIVGAYTAEKLESEIKRRLASQ